jgi:hypothetical protein
MSFMNRLLQILKLVPRTEASRSEPCFYPRHTNATEFAIFATSERISYNKDRNGRLEESERFESLRGH